MECTYRIGERTYHQRKLVLGQTEQLLALLKGVGFDGAAGIPGILMALGGRAADVFAVVLTRDGVPLADKDLEAEAAWLWEHMPVDLPGQVVADFFTCNPVHSVFDQWTALIVQLNTGKRTPGRSMNWSASWRAGIFSRLAAFCGKSPRTRSTTA